MHRAAACIYTRTHDVGLPTQFRFNVGPALQPIARLMTVNRLRCWPNINLTLGLLYTLHQHISKHMPFTRSCFNVELQPSTLAQHWVIVPCLLGYCHIAMRVTLSYPDAKKATSQITRYRIAQCWCNDRPPSATLGHHYPNQNPLSSWYNNIKYKYNREYYFFLTLFKNATVWPSDLKRYIRHVDKDWCTEMSTVSHTQQPSFP